MAEPWSSLRTAANMADNKKSGPGRTPRRDPYRLTGELFSERYRLDEFAGMGSFGAVYRATDTRVGRTVAVKILKPDLGDDEANTARELFQREAVTAGRLMHPHIVAVTDVGEESDFAYLVMEWLEGCTLEDELRTRVPFSPAETASLLSPIADALAAAHNAGVIHRDIKPSNIHLGRRERPYVKVLDFGIAKVVTSSTAVAASRIAGTVSYMSPEQIIGSRIDRRTDIYSLGIVLHQMLTGELPFKGESQGHIIQQHIAASPPSLAELRPDFPPALSGVIQRALAKLPEARQQSATDLYAEFTAALSESQPAPQPVQRSAASSERLTERMSSQLPPTVWAGHGAEPPPPSNFDQRSTVTAPDVLKQSAPPNFIAPHETGQTPEAIARPGMAANRQSDYMVYFAPAGVIFFPLLSVLFAHLIGVGSFEQIPNSDYLILSMAVFGLMFGITASALTWSRGLLYFVLGGAGAIVLLTLLAPSLIAVEWGYMGSGQPPRYLFLHNILVGAIIGAALCSLRSSTKLGRSIKAHLVYGAGCAVILMLLYYLYYLISTVDLVFALGNFLRNHLVAWMISAAIGFVIGLITYGLRISYKDSVR